MTPSALVLGASLNGLGVLRSLARAGIPCAVADCGRTLPAMLSRHGRKFVLPRLEGSELAEALLRLRPRFAADPVLLPTSDGAALAIAAAAGPLAAGYRFRLPGPDMLRAMAHKQDVQAAAERLDLPVPRAVLVRETADLARLDGLRFPCAVKPARRHAGYDARFRKAYRSETPAEAMALCHAILPVLPDIIVQEWIEGDDTDIHFMLQYRSDSGVLASFTGRKIRSRPPVTGFTASCCPAPEAAAALEPLCERFFTGLGLTGLCALEFKRDRRDGAFRLIEPTIGRTDWQAEIATLNGVNLPAAAWADLAGHSLPPCPTPSRPVLWCDLMAHHRAGGAPLPAGHDRREAYWRLDDPLPGVAAWGRMVMAKALHRRPAS